jgi:hypothetical protein
MARGVKRQLPQQPTPLRERVTVEAREKISNLARQYTGLALMTLAQVAESSKNDSARVAAASALLDRGWGKPRQPIEGEGGAPAGGLVWIFPSRPDITDDCSDPAKPPT